MLFTSEGRLVVFRTPVWFVFSKLVSVSGGGGALGVNMRNGFVGR